MIVPADLLDRRVIASVVILLTIPVIRPLSALEIG